MALNDVTHKQLLVTHNSLTLISQSSKILLHSHTAQCSTILSYSQLSTSNHTQINDPQSCYTHTSVICNPFALTPEWSIMIWHSDLRDPQSYYMNTSVTCIPITLTHTLVTQSCYTHTSVNFKYVTLTHTPVTPSTIPLTHILVTTILLYSHHSCLRFC